MRDSTIREIKELALQIEELRRLLGGGQPLKRGDVERVLEQTAEWLKIKCEEAERYEEEGVGKLATRRAFPLFVTMLIEIGAATIFAHYASTLSKAPVLASFMPLISAIAGNYGLQTAAAAIRAIAVGTVKGCITTLLKEVAIGLVCGCILGLSAGILAYIWHGSPVMATCVIVVMVASLMTSALFGVLAPMLFHTIGVDPAITAGPLETAMQDLTTYGLYLFLLTVLLK